VPQVRKGAVAVNHLEGKRKIAWYGASTE